MLSVLKPYFEKHWYRVTGDATWPIVDFCFSLLMAWEIHGKLTRAQNALIVMA